MSKLIIPLKRELFRVAEIVVDGHRPLRQIYCRRFDLVVNECEKGEVEFRIYIRDGRLDMSKAYELEQFIKGLRHFSWISIDNIKIIEQLSALLIQNPKWGRGKFSVEFYFTTRQIRQTYNVGLFYQELTLIMVRI